MDQYALAKKRAAYNEDNSGCTASQELSNPRVVSRKVYWERSPAS